MATIDNLNIKISADATKANNAIDRLVTNLNKLNSAMSGLNGNGLTAFSTGLRDLASAAKQMQGVDSRTFTAIANNMKKFTAMDSASMYSIASSLGTLSKQLKLFNTVNISESSRQVVDLSKALSKLGYKNMESAIQNIPKLTTEMMKLFQAFSNAPKIRDDIIRLVESLSKIGKTAISTAQSTTKTTSAWNKFSGVVGRIGGRIRQVAHGMVTTANAQEKTAKSTKSLAYYFGKLYASYFLVIRGIKALGRAISSSMDYVETYNYWNVAMQKIGKDWSGQFSQYGYESAEAYAESFQHRLEQLNEKMTGFSLGKNGELESDGKIGLGLDPQQLMNYQAKLMSVTNSVGLFGETSINTAKALSMLSADLSSLTNTDLDQVMGNLSSALIGQSRAVYKYGIDITNATLQEYALAEGITKKVSAMSQAEKMQLRVLAILDQSRVAWADEANTINSVANQYRIFKQQVANLARVLGNLFLPIVQKILPVVNGLIIALQKMFSALGVQIFGDGWQTGLMDGISGGAGGTDDMEEMADAGDDISQGLDNATDSAKKLKKAISVLPFDELNKLNEDSESGGSSKTPDSSGVDAGGAVDLTNAIANALAEYEKVWNDAFNKASNKAEEFADNITSAFRRIWDLAEPTRRAIANLYDNGFKKLENFTFGTLKDFWNKFLVPVGSWMLSDNAGLPRFFNLVNALLNAIDWGRLQNSLANLYSSLVTVAQFSWDSLMDFYEHFLTPLAVWTMGDGLPQLIDIFRQFIDAIDWDRLNSSLERLWQALAPLAVSVGQGIIDFFAQLFGFGEEFINGTVIGGFNGLADALSNIDPAVAEQIGNAIGFIVTALGGMKIFSLVIPLLEKFGTLFPGGLPTAILLVAMACTQAGIDMYALGEKAAEFVNKIVDGIDWQQVGTFLGESINGLVGIIAGFLGNVNWEQVGNSVGLLIRNAIDKIDWEHLGNLIGDFISGLSTIINRIIARIDWGDVTTSLLTLLLGIVENIKWTEVGFTLALWFAQKGIKGMGTNLVTLFTTYGLPLITSALSSIGSTIVTGLTTAVGSIIGAGGLLPIAGAIVAGLLLVLAIKNIDRIKEIGGNIINGIVEGIKNGVSTLTEWAKSIVDSFVGKFKELLGIHSPSTVFSEIGGYILEGLVGGLGEKVGDVLSWFGDLPGKIKDKLGDAKDWLKEKASGAISGFKSKLSSETESKVRPFAQGMGTNVKKWTGNAQPWLTDKGKDAMTGMNNAMKKARDAQIMKTALALQADIKRNVGETKNLLSQRGTDMMTGMNSAIQGVRDGNLRSTMSSLGSNIQTNVGSLDNLLTASGQQAVGGFLHGMQAMMSGITQEMGRMVSSIQSSTNSINLYNAGQSAINGFKRGFTSVKIPTPHLDVGWTQWRVGNSSFKTPRFSVNWYAKGGILNGAQLFGAMGNTLLGGGEAGREAVLPLDRNTSWMNDIADKVDAKITGGGNGLYAEMYSATNDANAKQNALLRELINVSKQLLDKDTTVEVTTGSIMNASNRANRRAGKTIMPVGG